MFPEVAERTSCSDFSLTDVRIQLESHANAPEHFFIGNGQEFFFRFYARFDRPLRTRAIFHYTVFSDVGKGIDDSEVVDPGFPAGTRISINPGTVQMTLPTGVSNRYFRLQVTLTANGQTVTRSTRFVIMR